MAESVFPSIYSANLLNPFIYRKVVGALGKVENIAHKAKQAGQKIHNLKHPGGALQKGQKVNKAIKGAKQAARKVEKVKHQVKKTVNAARKQTASAHHTAARRHHRRDLEDDEELFGREYDDFLAERDIFDDLD